MSIQLNFFETKNALIIQQLLNIDLSKLNLSMDYQWINVNNELCHGAFLKSNGKELVALVFPKIVKLEFNILKKNDTIDKDSENFKVIGNNKTLNFASNNNIFLSLELLNQNNVNAVNNVNNVNNNENNNENNVNDNENNENNENKENNENNENKENNVNEVNDENFNSESDEIIDLLQNNINTKNSTKKKKNKTNKTNRTNKKFIQGGGSLESLLNINKLQSQVAPKQNDLHSIKQSLEKLVNNMDVCKASLDNITIDKILQLKTLSNEEIILLQNMKLGNIQKEISLQKQIDEKKKIALQEFEKKKEAEEASELEKKRQEIENLEQRLKLEYDNLEKKKKEMKPPNPTTIVDSTTPNSIKRNNTVKGSKRVAPPSPPEPPAPLESKLEPSPAPSKPPESKLEPSPVIPSKPPESKLEPSPVAPSKPSESKLEPSPSLVKPPESKLEPSPVTPAKPSESKTELVKEPLKEAEPALDPAPAPVKEPVKPDDSDSEPIKPTYPEKVKENIRLGNNLLSGGYRFTKKIKNMISKLSKKNKQNIKL